MTTDRRRSPWLLVLAAALLAAGCASDPDDTAAAAPAATPEEETAETAPEPDDEELGPLTWDGEARPGPLRWDADADPREVYEELNDRINALYNPPAQPDLLEWFVAPDATSYEDSHGWLAELAEEEVGVVATGPWTLERFDVVEELEDGFVAELAGAEPELEIIDGDGELVRVYPPSAWEGTMTVRHDGEQWRVSDRDLAFPPVFGEDEFVDLYERYRAAWRTSDPDELVHVMVADTEWNADLLEVAADERANGWHRELAATEVLDLEITTDEDHGFFYAFRVTLHELEANRVVDADGNVLHSWGEPGEEVVVDYAVWWDSDPDSSGYKFYGQSQGSTGG